MRNIKLKLEYDGTYFCGWQKQINGRTVEAVLQHAIEKIVKEDIKLIGCSRTDSGVHAKEYVVAFKTNSKIPAEKFKDAINTKLPKDIVVLYSEEVSEEFHPRYHTKGKTYCYTILNSELPKAIGKDYMYHFKWKLDVDKMVKAAKYFIGTHDFNAFRSLGGSVKTTVRTIWDIKIEKDEEFIKIYVSGDGFLYNMVRIIVGTLIQVGRSKIEPAEIENIINQKDRKNAGKCAPAEGLCLEKVFY